MAYIRCAVLILGFWACPLPGAAAPACDLAPERSGSVARVLDAQTLVLETGETVRLVGALPPEAPPWWKEQRPWPPAVRARNALARLVVGRAVALAFGARKRDRHDRLLAQVFVSDGPEQRWVQGALIEQGHARAYSFPGNRACLRALQRREAQAREARAGLWRLDAYAVRAADDTAALLKRRYAFQIVEGRVHAVARRRAWTFLNFGADYRQDFTVAVRARDRKRFDKSDVPLAALAGRWVRVRGWIEVWNGPVIKATHPEQIELLDEAPADAQDSP